MSGTSGGKPRIVEKLCKTALSKTGVSSYDYTINPYTGCIHACVYCYANFMRRFSGHLQDAWGSFVDVKANLLDILGGELSKREGGRIWLSSVCDPYQPPEWRYRLTRGVIELISRYDKFSLSILTKSTLVLRDLDLLERMKERVDVGFTITAFDRDAQLIFEPHASPVQGRVDALRKLNEAGIDTWVFIAPILPHVTEYGLEEGLHQLALAGVKRLLTDRYNARGMVIGRTLQAYREWESNFNREEVRRLLWNASEYYHQVDEKIANFWKGTVSDATHERVF